MMPTSTIEIGAILVSRWGYEQTNICFYQVIKLSGQYAYLQPLNNKYLPKDSEYTDLAVPANQKDVLAFRRKVRNTSYGYQCIGITSYENAYLWDGTPQRETDARYGH